jgi:hypothetical protein
MGIIRRDKMKKLLILILLCLFFACQSKEPVFTLVEIRCGGYFGARERGEEYYYEYFILIKNIPNNKNELTRLMIHHFLDIASATDSLQSRPNLKFASCMFLKSTSQTRQRFYIDEMTSIRISDDRTYVGRGSYTTPSGRNSYGWYNNKTYVGNIIINRCEEDNTKLKSTMYMNSGTVNNYEFIQCSGLCSNDDGTILLNECEPDGHINNKDNELVKLFNEYYKKI